MLYDILAIQTLYGVNPNTNSDDNLVGEQAYKFKTGVDAVQAIWDAGGTDAIVASEQTQSVIIDLNPGHFSFVGKTEQTSRQLIAIAYRVEDPNFDWQNNWIENAVGGSGNDRLIGNDAANTLTGGKGSDTLEGGLGDDTYQLESTDNGFDRIIDSDRNGTIIVDGDIISDVFRPFVDGNAFYTEDKLYEFKKEKGSSNWQLSVRVNGSEWKLLAIIEQPSDAPTARAAFDQWTAGAFGITVDPTPFEVSPARVVLSYPNSVAYLNMDGSAATQGVHFDGGTKSDSFYGSTTATSSLPEAV